MSPSPAEPESRPDATASLPAQDTGGPDSVGATAPGADSAVPATGFDFLAPPQSADELGRLGPYRVLGVLGQGGMGMVFRADDPRLRRQIALKVMLPRYAADPHSRARFIREARAQAAVEHEHVIPIFEVEEDRGTPYIAMPLLKGMTLAVALKANRRPPVAEVVRIGREIAEGLAAAHEQGLIHRDIKPANVWLDGSRLRVKILDFGLARAASAADPAATGDEPLTADGAVAGTPQYMSPEQARGESVGPGTDLFSLGVLLYQMAVGKLPFAAPSTAATLLAVVSHHPTGLAEVNPPLPPVLNDLIARLLAKDAANRPASAEAVAEVLRQIELGLAAALPVQVVALDSVPGAPAAADPFADIDTTESGTAAPSPGHSGGRESPGASKLWLAGGVLGLLLVAGLAWAAYRAVTAKDPPAVTGDEPKPPPSTPAPVPKDVAKLDADRKAAEALRPHGAVLRLRLASGNAAYVLPTAPLPAEPFEIIGIGFVAGDAFPENLARDVILPQLEGLRSLERLSSTAYRFLLTRDDLERLAAMPSGPRITELTAGIHLTPEILATLKKFPGLTGFFGAGRFADDDLLLRLKELPNLAHLGLMDLGWNGKVTERGTTAITNLPLETLHLQVCKVLTPAVAQRIASMPKLQELSLYQTGIGDDTLDHFKGMVGLRKLVLLKTKVTEPGVEKLAQSLPACRIEWDGRVIEPKDTNRLVAAAFQPHCELLVVKLQTGEQVTLKPKDPLPVAPFDLIEIRTGDGPGLDFLANELLFNLSGLKSLESINDYSYRMKLTPDDLKRLADSPVAATLTTLRGNYDLTPDTLDLLKRFPKLTAITFMGRGVDDDVLVGLGELKGLARLSVVRIGEDGRVTDRGIKALAALPLEHLGVAARAEVLRPLIGFVGDKQLERLDLRGGLTDELAAGLAKCANVRSLMIGNTPITDAALVHLEKLTRLRYLNVKQTKVSKAGLEKLAAALPACRIVWDGDTIEPKQ